MEPINNGKELVRDANGRVVSGVLNPNGRPPETLNFKTKWLIFIDKIAKQNNITPDEVDEQLLAVAFKQMKSGDFRYWKDIQDRVYGTALNNMDLTSQGKAINIIIPQAVAETFGIKNGTDKKTGTGDPEQGEV